MKEHWPLDPEITFLNHGSFGACPSAVLAAQTRMRARMESEPVRFFMREYPELLAGVRGALARFLNAEEAGLVFVNNATSGVNCVLRSLELAAGDEIIIPDHGYRACRNALDTIATQRGARVVEAHVPFPIASPEQVTEAILAKVTPKTRFALVDHITSPTGLVFPIAAIVTALRARGVETIVDGAHAAGMVPLELSKIGAAFYTGNCHKWLCTPKGSAFLYVREDWRRRVRPLVIGHGATEPDLARKFQVEFDWTGTDDPTAVLCIPEALRFLEELMPGGWNAIRARNRLLALGARGMLCEALGIPAPAPESMIGALAAVPLPLLEGAEKLAIDPLQDRLFHRHKIEVPVQNWPSPRARLLRVAAQLYNEPRDYEKLATLLRREGTN